MADTHSVPGRTAISLFQDAAEKWASAKERLEQTRAESQRASEAYAQAGEDEHNSWNTLQEAAGRGEPRALDALRPPLVAPRR